MLVSAAGLAACGKIPFAATFAAFFTRAYDFIRMAAISQSNIELVGTHVGVSIEDGPSQMGLEDIAMMGAQPGVTVLYPSDGTCTYRLMEIAANHKGMVYSAQWTTQIARALWSGGAVSDQVAHVPRVQRE